MNQIKVMLLRGVNVGGANRLPMPEFRQMLTELGLGQVQTHIQSGNVVFADPGIADLEVQISTAMKDRFGFAPRLFILTLAQFDAVVAANPYAAATDGSTVHVFFLDAAFPAAEATALTALAARDEAVHFTKTAAYLQAPSGVGRSVLADKLSNTKKVGLTARNLNSVTAIAALTKTIKK